MTFEEMMMFATTKGWLKRIDYRRALILLKIHARNILGASNVFDLAKFLFEVHA